MCGILGAVGVKGNFDADLAHAGIATIAHRGPDDTGFWSEAGTELAHCRLSVLDTSSAGHQPMVSPDQRYVLVFNGEIYNFRELREELSDTYLAFCDSIELNRRVNCTIGARSDS